MKKLKKNLIIFTGFIFIILLFSIDILSQEILPGSISTLSDYIELYYPGSFIFTSQTGYYGIADQTYFSFYGNNHEHNLFYINNYKINSYFFTGTPFLNLPLKYFTIFLDPFDSSIKFFVNIPLGINLELYSYFGGIWGIFPYASEINLFFSGHLAAIERNPISSNDRRKTNYLFGFNLVYNGDLKNYEKNIIFLSLDIGQRTFLSYFRTPDQQTLYDVINEDFIKLQYINLFYLNSSLNFILSFNYNYRTNYGSEFYFSEEETKQLNSFYFYVGIDYSKSFFSNTITFQFEANELNGFKSEYEKELIDVDGESLNILLPDSQTYDFALIYNGKIKVSDQFLINIESDSCITIFNPVNNAFTYNLLYNGTYFSKIEFTSNETSWFISNSKINFQYLFVNKILSIKINATPGLSLLYIQDENFGILSFLNLDFNMDLIFFPLSDFKIKIDIGKKTPEITSSLAKVLSSNYLNGSYYNSSNTFLFHTLGNINDIADNLKNPSYLYFSISFSYKNNDNFYFSVDSQFRSFQNLFWVRANNSSSYSSYEYNNQTLWYISDSDINYVLTNYSEAINWMLQNGLIPEDYFSQIPEFLRNPFYLGILFTIGKKSADFFINISFWAYMVVGVTCIGNGIFEDEIGNISENQADPNTYIYGIGRMISDRSYVFKFNIGFRIIDSLWLSLVIRYRDGQPFTAFNESISPNNNLIIYNQYMPGDNPFTGQMGRREDCIWEFNFDISGKFYLFNKLWDISIVLYNFFDLAFEIVENAFNINHRQPLELQIPPTISVTLSFDF